MFSRLSPQVFWLAGSLLIISMASVVIPTIGWRWLIRIASIPGIILIMAFKVVLLKLPLCYLSAGPQASFLHICFYVLNTDLLSFSIMYMTVCLYVGMCM